MSKTPVALADLNREKFNTEWRESAIVRRCSVAEVASFVEAHYLRKRPAIVLLCLRLEIRGLPVGAVLFSAPPKEVERRYGGKTWELARLFIEDFVPRNAETWLVARAVRYVKRHHRDVCFLLSYADPSVGHRGYVYLAGNWHQDGRTDQERKTPRNDYADARTGKKYGRKGNMPPDAIVQRVPRVSKFRFYLNLQK